MKTITTNEIKKGDRITLRCGWEGTMQDNKKGNIRFAEIEGVVTELGSIYAHDILYAVKGGETFLAVSNNVQKKLKQTVEAIWGSQV